MTKRKKTTTTTEIIRCSHSGLVSCQEHNNTAAIWSGCTDEARKKSVVDFLLSSFSYIKKKVFWDTGNNWIFLQTEQGVGVGAMGGIHSLSGSLLYWGKNQHSFYFIFFPSGCQQRAGLVVAATGNLAISRGRAAFLVWWARARHGCWQETELLRQVIGHHQLKKTKKQNRNSTVWTLAHTHF